MAGPIERKVQASTAAAAVSGLALWALGRYVFKGGVPDVVASWTYVLVPSVITFAAGYAARHTNRLPAQPPPLPVIAMPADTSNMQKELDVVWDKLLPALHTEVLPENPAEHQLLQKTLGNLTARDRVDKKK